MTHPTDDQLHEERMCTCGAGHGSLEGHMDWCHYVIALAAAPQPMGCGLPCGYDCNGACFDAAAPQPAPVEREALVEVIRSVVPLSVKHLRTLADALLARGLRLPAPKPEPRRCAECTCEGGEHECNWIKPGPDKEDALQQLAGLGQQADRASETMAWAVVGEDGEVIPGSIYPTRDEAERVCDYEGERVVRVAIRVVEGGDDAA